MMSSSDASPFKVVIDFGFEDLMTDKVGLHVYDIFIFNPTFYTVYCLVW